MATSETEIANLALTHLGVGKEIANLETERSEEARAIRAVYDMARNATLRDGYWPFATKRADLTLIETDPNEEWGYSYRYPTDCVKLHRIIGGLRNDNRQSRVPYKIEQDDSGWLIYCDLVDAEAEYTKKEETVERYPDDFVLALSYRIAHLCVARLTSGDPFKLAQRTFQFYQYECQKSLSNALNEEQVEEEPQSEFIRARE